MLEFEKLNGVNSLQCHCMSTVNAQCDLHTLDNEQMHNIVNRDKSSELKGMLYVKMHISYKRIHRNGKSVVSKLIQSITDPCLNKCLI